MSVDVPGPLAGGAVASRTLEPALTPEARTEADRQRVAESAKQFEAMFLLQMLKQMRQSMLSDGEEEPGLGAATMFDTIDSELARQLASQGTGLAPMLLEGMTRAVEQAGGAGAAAPAGPMPLAPAVPGARTIAVPRATGGAHVSAARSATVAVPAASADPEAFEMPVGAGGSGRAVTSAFGWRRDPLDGTRRFHAGVDLRAAYGETVASAAGGRVVFAGEQPGYGQSVVVEHAPGLRTRYAHLSGIAVRPGDSVEAGDPVGRVGQSGRATGPHLHFEVLEGGVRVDPASGAARLAAALKLQRASADSPTGTAGTTIAGTPGAEE